MGILSHRHTHLHTRIVLCPGNTPCHLSQQSRTPGAPFILMNPRFSRHYLSPGLRENKPSGTRLTRLHCHNSCRLFQPLTMSTPQRWRASLLCAHGSKAQKTFHKFRGLVLLAITSMKMQLYLMRATAGALGLILGSTELLELSVNPRRIVQQKHILFTINMFTR